jgi:LPPG:FO 2-phospho-L-lactate transferase
MNIVALSGGVGGSKLCLGLAQISQHSLRIGVNTGDDFEHLGLSISPDLDTVMYTLAGLCNSETGWGRANESWHFLESLRALGGETWFALGDRDLAVHVERTRRLRAGESLSRVTRGFAAALGITSDIIPMSDDPVRTMVCTPDGELPFQRYFVEKRAQPVVTGFRYAGAETARPSDDLLFAIDAADAIIICPSNPFVSVDPILAVPGVMAHLQKRRGPLIAVSPIIGGRALKGPAAKMLSELGLAASATSIAQHYLERGLLDGFVFDRSDAGLEKELGVPALATQTIMSNLADRVRLAEEVLRFIGALA